MRISLSTLQETLAKLSWRGATADSRAVMPGMIFCAYRGMQADGHCFAESALQKGASVIVCEKKSFLSPGALALLKEKKVPCLEVGEGRGYPMTGLVAEMAAGFPARKLKIIGVTGTNGKTTTTWLIREILQKAGISCGLIGTVQYDLGQGEILPGERTTPTPFELQDYMARMVAHGVTHLVMEVSSHSLALGRLGTLQCEAALFTNLTQDHLDFHKTLENYYQAKRLLFTRHLRKRGIAVVPPASRLVKELKRLRPDLRLVERVDENVVCSPGGSRFTQGKRSYFTPLPGHYNVENASGAAALATALHLSREKIRQALSQCMGAPGRLQRLLIPVGEPGAGFVQSRLIYVDYAHTDDAISNLLLALRALPHHRLAILFGCGGDRDKTKRPKMAQAAVKGADFLWVTSDNPRTEEPDSILDDIFTGFTPKELVSGRITRIANRREAIFKAVTAMEKDDILVLAGKGHENYQEIQGKKLPFDDLAVAREAVLSLG